MEALEKLARINALNLLRVVFVTFASVFCLSLGAGIERVNDIRGVKLAVSASFILALKAIPVALGGFFTKRDKENIQ